MGGREQRILHEATAATRYDRVLAQRLAELKAKEQHWRQREVEEIKADEHALAQRLAAHDAEIAGLPQAEHDDLQRRLRKQQDQFVANYLARQSVDVALITGIGPAVKQRLRQHGIVRANDVTPACLAAVPGIGEGRAAVILDGGARSRRWPARPRPKGCRKSRNRSSRAGPFSGAFPSSGQGALPPEAGRDGGANPAPVREPLPGPAAQETEAQAVHHRKQEEVRRRRTAALQLLRQDRTRGPGNRRQAPGRPPIAWRRCSATWRSELASSVERQLRQFEGIDFGSYLRQLLPR